MTVVELKCEGFHGVATGSQRGGFPKDAFILVLTLLNTRISVLPFF
jgi:hypothetical protein